MLSSAAPQIEALEAQIVLTPEMAADWLENSFQLVEIVVDPPAQGHGVGGRLHDHLLAGIRQDRAVLTTLQAETVAHPLYRSRGWVVLGEDLFFSPVCCGATRSWAAT